MADYRHYRKFFEPNYGGAAPDAVIHPSQTIDAARYSQERIRANYETMARLSALWQPCYCYRRIMRIKTVNTAVPGGVPLRLYLPEGEGPFPVLVFCHGGGWSLNSVDVYDFVFRYLAEYGKILVVSPEYRLAPEDRFPKGLQDVYSAVVWAAEHAQEYGGCPGSLSVCGDSAGGNLVAAAALMARDQKGPAIQKQFLIYPVTAFAMGYRSESEKRYGNGEYGLTMNSEAGLMWGHYLNTPADAEDPLASPLYAEDLRGLPPACFLSAECDPLLDQALMYAARLEDAGVPVEYHLYEGMVHAFINRPQQKTFEALNAIIAAIPPGEK